jgi:hypothetical protein
MALADHMEHLPRDKKAPSPTREQRIITHAIDSLTEADFDALGEPGPEGTFQDLAKLLSSIDWDLRSLSETITHYYFSHAEVRVS